MTDKTVQITEAEYNESQRLRGQVAKLFGNKKARALVEKAYKELDPTAATPTADELEQANAPIDALRKDFNEFVKAENDRREKEETERKVADFSKKMEEQYAELRAQGYTDEGIAAVKKLVEEKNLFPLDAAAIHERNNPPQATVVPTGNSGAWNFMQQPDDGDKDIKDLIASKGESEPVLGRMISKAINDIRPSHGRR